MRMDEHMGDEAALAEAKAEGGAVANETHAAKWARPRLEAFDCKQKTITFQVNFQHRPSNLVCLYFLGVFLCHQLSSMLEQKVWRPPHRGQRIYRCGPLIRVRNAYFA